MDTCFSMIFFYKAFHTNFILDLRYICLSIIIYTFVYLKKIMKKKENTLELFN